MYLLLIIVNTGILDSKSDGGYMTCECGAKMKCVFSIPVEGNRYRVYHCRFDDLYRETVEVQAHQLGLTQQEWLNAGRARRFGMLRALKKGG